MHDDEVIEILMRMACSMKILRGDMERDWLASLTKDTFMLVLEVQVKHETVMLQNKNLLVMLHAAQHHISYLVFNESGCATT